MESLKGRDSGLLRATAAVPTGGAAHGAVYLQARAQNNIVRWSASTWWTPRQARMLPAVTRRVGQKSRRQSGNRI